MSSNLMLFVLQEDFSVLQLVCCTAVSSGKYTHQPVSYMEKYTQTNLHFFSTSLAV